MNFNEIKLNVASKLNNAKVFIVDKFNNIKNAYNNNKIFKEIVEWIFCIIIAYIIYLFINYFVGTISTVKQVSMNNTLIEGDKLLVRRNRFFKKNLNYGDIITFPAPDYIDDSIDPVDKVTAGEFAKAKYYNRNIFGNFVYDFLEIGKKNYIKRVIGLPGDRIYIDENGKVFVNDKEIEENYLKDGTTNINGNFYDIIVPEDAVFAMGDNRLNSMDSRYFGCIPLNKVEGVVITRVWPFNKFGKVN